MGSRPAGGRAEPAKATVARDAASSLVAPNRGTVLHVHDGSARVQQALHDLEQSLEGRSPHELHNLARDLSALRKRLLAGEYTQTDFEARNVFDVQRRTREYLAYFAGWNRQATRWAALLSGIVREGDEVLDLCPGWAPKIELALLKLGFDGVVRMLDKDLDALTLAREFLDALAPRFTLVPVCADLFANPPAARGTLVVGNHLVDDVLLASFIEQHGLDPFTIYEDETTLGDTWRRLLTDADELVAELPSRLATALAAHVAPGGRLVLSHYPSNVERLIGEASASALFQRLFDATRHALVDRGLEPLTLRIPAPSRRFNADTVAVLQRPANA